MATHSLLQNQAIPAPPTEPMTSTQTERLMWTTAMTVSATIHLDLNQENKPSNPPLHCSVYVRNIFLSYNFHYTVSPTGNDSY